ncbi:transcription termination factor Rho [Corynebacterium gerontici]|uniref:Transcription termination factor Rho n=1 Tax=Corynebacterium gerontici TaxID=2079234 RepID=A0A3G6J0C0_9CORY|nr:transcription termination factor Rho [Corynebacterium gerontici]AZA11233.1 hypothetical protein CGERO_04585 [Corynebacterium gerontici]
MSQTDQGATRQEANLAGLRLPELRKIAAQMGLRGVSALRKNDLIAAIKGAQSGDQQTVEHSVRKGKQRVYGEENESKDNKAPESDTKTEAKEAGQEQEEHHGRGRRRRAVRASHVDPAEQQETSEESKDDADEQRYESRSAARRARRNRARRDQQDEPRQEQRQEQRHDENDESADAADNLEARNNNRDNRENRENRDNRGQRNNRDDSNERGNRRNRRNRRGRDDNRNDNRDNRDNRNEQNQGREDENLLDVAGILDIVDNNVAFIRTTGYHSGPADVYVNSQMVRRFGLRAGDAIIGKARPNNDQGGRGRNRQKYNPLVRVESVNGVGVEEAKQRPQFSKLTPLYPNQRLRLETDPKVLTTRVIDLIMPIGKGQRALIVSPPKAGKTTILQNIANAIATNNPECYLMVVLVDERPEEVTDMQRSVKGEVIASTFDRPPSEHTAVAELAIERAKRLVEQGMDVVVLLDSITRLGRAYNNSSPASGRILSGGVDSNALYPPKRFLGAARNIENGGSLTIIATAMVETGSAGDTVIFEEFKGTGNAELKLDRKISERRVFPAVDVNPSGTRKDELLLPPEEARVMHKLRRILSALDSQAAIDLLIKQLKKTRNNGEFLMQVMSSAPMAADSEEE